MTKNKLIHLIIDSDLEHVALVGTAIKGMCSFCSLSEEMCSQLEIAVVEAVNNAILHAYDNRLGNNVDIYFCLEDKKIMMKVCDNGNSIQRMPEFDIEEPIKQIDKIPESGRGLQIIHQIMDKVDYQSKEGKNCFTLTKYLKNIRNDD